MKSIYTPAQFLELLPKWRSVQKPSEFVELLKRAASLRVETVLEIGVCYGGTLRAWQAMLPADGLIVGVDRNLSTVDPSTALPPAETPKTILIEGESASEKTIHAVNVALNGRDVDVLWIDGDHSYEGVKKDFENYSPFVSHGGLIAFHDVAECPTQPHVGVRRFWKEIAGDPTRDEEIIHDPLGWGGIGILWV